MNGVGTTSWLHTPSLLIGWNKDSGSGHYSTTREPQVKGDYLLKLSGPLCSKAFQLPEGRGRFPVALSNELNLASLFTVT